MCSSYAPYILARCILHTWSTKLCQTNNDYLYIILLLLFIHKNISSPLMCTNDGLILCITESISILYLSLIKYFNYVREEKETAVAKFNDIEEGAELPLINSEEVSSEPSTPLATEDIPGNTAIVPLTQSSTTDEYIWPSIGDLNNRVRRLISTCQRNFKKEEQKLVQKAKVSII